MEEQKRAACKRKMKAFYRRQAKASRLDGVRSSRTKLSPGMIGFLCTCGSGGERWCVREAYNLLNQFAELMHGPENAAVNETTKDSTNETTKDMTNETTANTTTDTTSETIKDTTDDTTKDITNETTKDTTSETIKDSTNETTTDTTSETIKDTTDDTTNNTNDTKESSNDISTDTTNDDTGKSDVCISRERGQDKGGQVATVDGCDMEAAFEAELAQLRRQTVTSGNGDTRDGSGDGGVRPRRRFQQVLCPVSNCVFISTTLEEPGPLVERIMNHVQETGVQCCRHLIRMLPVDVVCKADEKSLSAALDGLLPGCFPADSAVTYSVVYKRRHQCKLGEETVRQLVAECVGRLRAGLTSVDYRCPELCVLVDGIANIALLTVVRRYFQYKKYNLIELARSSSCHDNASDGGGGRVAMATSTSDNQTATTENTTVSMETKEDNVDAGVHNENTTATDAVSMATPVDSQCCHSNQSE